MRVAAIQMTSGHEIEANLEVAGRFLAEAARLGAVLAALPENFAFMGQDSGDKRVIAEPDGAGRIQNFLADTARRLKIWVVGGTVPLRQDRRRAGERLVPGVQVRRTAGGALRQDAPVRRGRAGQHRVASRIGAHRSGARCAAGRYADRQARARGVLRHALSGAVPGAVAPGRGSVRGAVGVHGADRAGALGSAAARARHREPRARSSRRRSGACTRAGARRSAIR